MLRFAEELLLLLLDEQSGDLITLPAQTLDLALAGAVLMDLQREARIDTDLDALFLADATPLDDDLLDPTLAAIAREDEKRDARFWVEHAAQRGEEIRQIALSRLVERGILELYEGGILALLPLVARSRRYPTIDGVAREEVRLRIMRILFSDEIPDPDDIVLICLVDACDLFPRLLSASELEEAQARIEVVGQLDLLGQAVTRAIREIGDRPVSRAAKDIPQVRGLPILGSAPDLSKGAACLLHRAIPEPGTRLSDENIQAILHRTCGCRSQCVRAARGAVDLSLARLLRGILQGTGRRALFARHGWQ